MTYVHTASQANDVPCENGQLSEALNLRLAEKDLLDLATLLRYRGVRTLRALESLETNERAVLLCKARDLCALYGIFPSNLKKALDNLFGDEAACFGTSRVGCTWPLQPGSVGATACAMPASARASASPLWAGGGGFSSSSGDWCSAHPRPAGPAPVGPVPVPSPQVEELPAAAEDDTRLKRTLAASLEGGREIVGRERYAQAIYHFRRSEELVVASCVQAAEAVASLTMLKEDLPDKVIKELCKAMMKDARDVLLWRCTGSSLGLDSKEATARIVEDALKPTSCGANLHSQIMNGYKRIKEELAGVRRTTIALSPSRSRAPGRQEAGARANTVEARSPHGPAGARLAADGAQARGAAAAGPQAGCSANQELVAPPLVQVMNQPVILCHSLGAFATPSQAPLLAPGGPVR